MRTPRSFRAVLKVSLFAFGLLALYHLTPVLFGPNSSSRTSAGAYKTPDPRLRRNPAGGRAHAQPTAAPPGLDYEAEKRRWAQGQRVRNGAGGGGGRDRPLPAEVEPREPQPPSDLNRWGQRDGGAPPRRRPDENRPQPARVQGLNPIPPRLVGVEARRKVAAAERQRGRDREREEQAAAAIAAVRAARAGGRGGANGDNGVDHHGRVREDDDGGTYEAELAVAAARQARAREKLREWDRHGSGKEEEEQEEEEANPQRRGRGERKPAAAKGDAGAPADRAQRVAAAVREQRQQAFGGGGGGEHELAEEDGELDAAPRGAGPGRRVAAALPRRKKGPLIQVGGARAAAALGGGADDEARVVKQQQPVAAAKDGGGWGQRFKKPQPAAAAAVLPVADDPVNEGVGGKFVADSADPEASEEQTTLDADEAAVGAPEKFNHQLVARFAKYDYSLNGGTDRDALLSDPSADDSLLLSPNRAGKGEKGDARVNMTICALVPNENRFIGEWLLYHRLLGVERFALYDTSTPGAFGAAEVDALADRMQREGGGELGPTVDELKASVGTTDAGPDGLDDEGHIRKERIAGMERWIDQGVVRMHWLNFSDKKKSRDFHAHMLDHCTATYGASSNWLAHLDVDEFLSVSSGLYGADAPYRAGEALDGPWQFPLHDVLARPALAEAACVPVPELHFRNYGVRELAKDQSLLEAQTHRDVLKQSKKVMLEEGLQQKTLIHTAYSRNPIAYFAGPHTCEVSETVTPPGGLTREIRNSQGSLLQEGGLYETAKLPIEPLAIAHYLQRDLRDCLSKLSSLSDPNDLHSKSRGIRSCEEHYLPTAAERRALEHNQQNRFLLETPPAGTVIEDQRMSNSWAAKATRQLRAHGYRLERASLGGGPAKKGAAGGPRLRGQGRAREASPHEGEGPSAPQEVVERARRKVLVVSV